MRAPRDAGGGAKEGTVEVVEVIEVAEIEQKAAPAPAAPTTAPTQPVQKTLLIVARNAVAVAKKHPSHCSKNHPKIHLPRQQLQKTLITWGKNTQL